MARSTQIVATEDVTIYSASVHILLATSLLLILVLYAGFPTYYMLGGRDPGLYFLFAEHIARTGGLHFYVPGLGAAHKQYGTLASSFYPALYNAARRGLSSNPSVLIPQFQHLFPALAANFYSAGGIAGLVRANAFVAVVALWGYFITARRVAGYWPALLSMIALGICPAVIWEARITLTEALSMAILFGGLAFLWNAIDARSRNWGALAGIVLGCSLFNRIDGGFAGLAVVGASLYAIVYAPKIRRVVVAIIAGYAVASSLGFIDGYVHSHPYFHDLWMRGSLKALVGLNYGVILISAILLALPERLIDWIAAKNRMTLLAAAGAVGLTAWLIFSYFVRPHFGQGLATHASVELGWYVSPAAYPFFLIGLFLAVRSKNWKYVLPLLLIAGAAVFVYTLKPSISPDLIWATRRWVPYTIPMLVLFAAISLRELWQICGTPTAKVAIAGTCGGLMIYYGWHSYVVAKPFLFKSMLAGLPAQYAELAQYLDKNLPQVVSAKPIERPTWVATTNAHVASFLTFAYGIPTIWVRGTNEQIRSNFSGRLIVGALPPFSGYRISRTARLCGLYLAKVTGALPTTLYNRCYGIDVGVVQRLDARFVSTTVPVSSPAFNSRSGTLAGTGLKSNGRAGFLLFGPYSTLQPGTYTVTWNGSLLKRPSDDTFGFVDVSAENGSRVIRRKKLVLAAINSRSGEVATIRFKLNTPARRVEFRVYVKKNVELELKSVTLEKASRMPSIASGNPTID